MAWALDPIPDLTGRVALVTGANSGIGFETARALARHRAEAVLACRDLDKAATAVAGTGRPRWRASQPQRKYLGRRSISSSATRSGYFVRPWNI